MRLVVTIANWKRTGPVEPALDGAAGLAARGHEVLVATGRPVGTAPDDAGAAADARGLTRLDLGLTLRKHGAFLANRRDARRLAAHLAARPPDVVLCTLRNDHRVVARAIRRAGLALPVVRAWFEDGATPPSPEEAHLLAGAARVLVFGAAPSVTLRRFGVGDDRIVRLPPPLDVARWQRVRATLEAPAALRARWSPPPDALVVGLVARVQPHRRFDLLWDALTLLVARRVPVLAVVVGRGTSFRAVAAEPVRARGLASVVRFAGYLRGAAYAAALASFHAQCLLVPGSDPTVRALREGMALGVPSIATRRGLLPDLVEDGRTGLLVDETPEALADAIERLARDPARCARLGAEAAVRAEAFALPRVAAALEAACADAVAAAHPR